MFLLETKCSWWRTKVPVMSGLCALKAPPPFTLEQRQQEEQAQTGSTLTSLLTKRLLLVLSQFPKLLFRSSAAANAPNASSAHPPIIPLAAAALMHKY